MLSRSLRIRTADFLAQYPPYTFLSREALEELAGQVRIRFYGEGEYIFEEGQPASGQVYILQKGQVEFVQQAEGEHRLIDVCDVGDTFGMRSFLSGNPYLLSARVEQEALVYLIDREVFAPLLEAWPRLALYFASGFAAGQAVVRATDKSSPEARSGELQRKLLFRESSKVSLFREEDVMRVKPTTEVLSCTPEHRIREACALMAARKVNSILVLSEERHPLGILTSTDITRKVGSGDFGVDEMVSRVMSRPVVCVPPGRTIAHIILQMMRHKLRHLVVTEDGSDQSPVRGIISEHDVLIAQGNNPAVLVKQMIKARSATQLAGIRNRAEALTRAYLEQELSVPFIADTLTEINDALIHRAIELSLAQLESEGLSRPALAFCWLSLGSEGRGEQLLRTDQDNALLYEDPPPAQAEAVQAYFLRLGKAVTDILEACGFAHCPGEIMASNPHWNQSLAGWKRRFSQWIRKPEPQALMHGTIFFDFRPTYGDFQLAEQLNEHLFAEMAREQRFIHFFAQNALQNPPPLSFFRNFIVERSGNHKDEFDIKLRGMMPLADAARVLLLHKQETGSTNTFHRFARLAELEPQNRDLYEEAGMAYELLMRHRALNGLRHGDSGRFIDPRALNKIERQTLKYAFRTIEALQSLLKTRFSLGMLG